MPFLLQTLIIDYLLFFSTLIDFCLVINTPNIFISDILIIISLFSDVPYTSFPVILSIISFFSLSFEFTMFIFFSSWLLFLLSFSSSGLAYLCQFLSAVIIFLSPFQRLIFITPFIVEFARDTNASYSLSSLRLQHYEWRFVFAFMHLMFLLLSLFSKQFPIPLSLFSFHLFFL